MKPKAIIFQHGEDAVEDGTSGKPHAIYTQVVGMYAVRIVTGVESMLMV